MAELPDMPWVRLILAMRADMAAVDYRDLAGIQEPVTLRFSRNRKPVRSERPSITIIMVGAVPTPSDTGVTQDEVQMRLTVDLQADLELTTEESGDDITGLSRISKMLGAGFRSLRLADAAIKQLSDWVSAEEVDPEDRATPEDGRLVWSVTVLYRVRSDDETVLLAAGENG